jgi:hypothetical protein
MPTTPLNYQRPEDYRDERRRALGGVDYGAAWEAIAVAMDAQYVAPKWMAGPGKIISRVGQWTLTLEGHPAGEDTYSMRIRAPFRLATGFRFRLRPFGFFDQLGEYLCLRGPLTGDGIFDANFVTRTNRADLARGLLGRGDIRRIYRSFTDATLEVAATGIGLPRRPRFPCAARVELCRPGLSAELETLGRMHALVTQTLEALVELKIALPQRPDEA